MTLMERELQTRSKVISMVGQGMLTGLIDCTPENESMIQRTLSALIELNEKDKASQDKVFEREPWLRNK